MSKVELTMPNCPIPVIEATCQLVIFAFARGWDFGRAKP